MDEVQKKRLGFAIAFLVIALLLAYWGIRWSSFMWQKPEKPQLPPQARSTYQMMENGNSASISNSPYAHMGGGGQ
ncbi:MAG TPA: hypothetical protein VKV29_11680 [Chthonomonas sp.]|jgi:hypothetical protein|uniref:hypothetical protein n=1 Tax=Chthonomonas sp. TaxID=2282153 RepID=UPI002B4AFF2A|nr:hypothetical protein [Chthonomonas sp.]HLH80927.1 hypothetical protein [Chthonomonas sp.]